MKNSTILFLHRMFKGIADATIKVFIPLLIYKATQNLLLCFVYAAGHHLLTAVFFALLKRFVQRNSLLSIILHFIPIVVAEFLLIGNLNIWIILIVSVLTALTNALYYGAINLIFGTIDENSNVAKFEAGQNAGKIIFALLSAYVLGELTNSIVFVVVSSVVLYIASVIPLCVKYNELKQKLVPQPKANLKQILKDTKYFNLHYICTGMLLFFNEVVLPLYLYTTGLSFTAVGVLVAGQYAINIAGGYLGKFLQSKKLEKLGVILSSVLFTASAFVMLFVKNTYVLYAFTIVFSFAYYLMFTIIYRKFTTDQKQKNYFYHTIFYRDVFQNGAECFCASVFLVAPLFTVMFGVGIASCIGIGATGYTCLTKYKNNSNTEIAQNKNSGE